MPAGPALHDFSRLDPEQRSRLKVASLLEDLVSFLHPAVDVAQGDHHLMSHLLRWPLTSLCVVIYNVF